MNVPLNLGAGPAGPPGVELGEPDRPPLCCVGAGPVKWMSSRTRLDDLPDPAPRSANAPAPTAAAISPTAATIITLLRL
jgi:hypothetical protein